MGLHRQPEHHSLNMPKPPWWTDPDVSAWIRLPVAWFACATALMLLGGGLAMLTDTHWDAKTLLVLGHLLLLPSAVVLANRAPRFSGIAFEVAALVVLPLVGLAINLDQPSCEACTDMNRPVDGPGLVFIYGLHFAGVAASVVARVRPKPLIWFQESLLLAGLLVGAVTSLALVMHFHLSALMGLVVVIPGLPLVAPLLCLVYFLWTAVQRVLAHTDPRVRAHSGLIAAFTLGVSALSSSLLSGVRGLYGGALTQTCDWGLSQLQPPPVDCHYLCTVAAQGHPWLVRPLRMGVRRGRPIVVNRQLAVANAFEDLLHERWPRFGHHARQSYDRWGRPISHLLQSRWAASLVFLAMLPAQVAFGLFLLFFDPGEPEARIDRMYRPPA